MPRASADDGSAFGDTSELGEVGRPSASDSEASGIGRPSGASVEVDAGQLSSGGFEDGGDDAVAVENHAEVTSGSGAGVATDMDIDAKRLVVEDEAIVVDADEDDEAIEVGSGKGHLTREDFELVVFDDLDGSSLIHADEVDGLASEGVASDVVGLIASAEPAGRDDHERDAFVGNDFEGDLLIDRAFDIQPTIEFGGGAEVVEVVGRDERDAVLGGDFMVIEPLEGGVHRGEGGGGGDGRVNIVAKAIAFDLFGDFGEGVGIDFGDDFGAVGLSRGASDDFATRLLVIEELDGEASGPVLGHLAGLPCPRGGGIAITALADDVATGIGVGLDAFGFAKGDVVAPVVGEGT